MIDLNRPYELTLKPHNNYFITDHNLDQIY
jgi:hypothetical protein